MLKHNKHSPARLFSSKVSAMSTTTLDQEVDTAEGKYEIFRSRLHSLITTLKEHHGAMVKLNEAHLKTTKAVCDLLIDTKVSKVVIGAGDCPASSVIATKEISLKDQPHEKDEEENKENKPEVQENKPTDETKSSSSVSTPSKATEKLEEQSAHVSEAATTPVFHMPDEYTHSFHKVIDGKSLVRSHIFRRYVRIMFLTSFVHRLNSSSRTAQTYRLWHCSMPLMILTNIMLRSLEHTSLDTWSSGNGSCQQGLKAVR